MKDLVETKTISYTLSCSHGIEWALNKKIHRLAIPSQPALAVHPREFGLGDLELHVRIRGSSEQVPHWSTREGVLVETIVWFVHFRHV